MRIVQISKYYPPEIGGIENHVKAISDELASMGYDVLVLAVTRDDHHKGRESNKGSKIEIVRFKPLVNVYHAPKWGVFRPGIYVRM